MSVSFTKMQGLGNDFVVIDLITQAIKLRIAEIKQLADRHFGVGCDQVLLIEPPVRMDADFYYRIFNANGQEVEQCGNGARCAARFFYENRLTHQRTLVADCLAGTVHCFIEDNKTVTLNMGIPVFDPKQHSVEVDGVYVNMRVLSMGNPHAIIQVSNLDPVFIKKMGPLLSTHVMFPNEANIGFMQIVNRSEIRLRTYERGVGATYACGTNACAAVVAGVSAGLLETTVKVQYQAGFLTVRINDDKTISLTGPATQVFTGQFYFH